MCCSVSSGDGNTSLSNRHIVGSASSSSQSAQDLVIDIYTWAYQFIHEKCIIHLLVTLIIIAIIVVVLKWFPILARFQVIDHIEAIVLSVSWSNLEMLLFTHVLTQNRCICEYLLAVQALKSGKSHISVTFRFEHTSQWLTLKACFPTCPRIHSRWPSCQEDQCWSCARKTCAWKGWLYCWCVR